VEHFLPYIKYQALRIASRLPGHIDVEDLIQAGVMGLLSAFSKYDANRNTQFKTYAEFRIRGAMLDELRNMDWASRSTRTKIKLLEEAYARMEQELKRCPEEEEVAESLGLDMEQFHHLVLETRGIGVISIEDLLSPDITEHGNGMELGDSEDPYNIYLGKELKALVREALEILSEREQMVLNLYYYEELTMREIGMVLGVTESRVSQIHAQALIKLKRQLSKTSGRIQRSQTKVRSGDKG
jgi:RNA polymerase sigma factor for flagellar operon FliA